MDRCSHFYTPPHLIPKTHPRQHSSDSSSNTALPPSSKQSTDPVQDTPSRSPNPVHPYSASPNPRAAPSGILNLPVFLGKVSGSRHSAVLPLLTVCRPSQNNTDS
ncbi:hypothetical protein JZ751_004896 [Albula glossodonta]|uniref:Uncharacterized protein n=1 Tax=Albula glossodonta TaxID=121402 RepID=A0A8T2P4V9_9TELE|nr:hypothetical protein JZ751_004896 [Albula glossodonta]